MFALAPLWLLFACTSGAEDDPSLADRDGDGVVAAEDCDDRDPRRAPGFEEECDRLDNDCDELVDEADADLTDGATWFLDADGDGAGDGLTGTILCTRTDGYVAQAGDCDDTDATVSTSSTWYADEDGDGFGDPEQPTVACGAPPGHVAPATDCDDGASGVHPEADEICGDGVDQDCDGTPSGCGPLGDVTLPGDGVPLEGDDDFGTALASLGAPGGVPTFAIGSPTADDDGGEIGIYTWADGALTPLALVTDAPVGAAAGTRLAAADLDGDGAIDLLVGGVRSNGAWLLPGPLDADRSLEGAAHLLPEGSAVTAAVAPAGDHDDDGVADVLLTFTGGGTTFGYVASGTSTGEVDAASALATLTGPPSLTGAAAAGLGDTDGDGLDDLAVVDTSGTDTTYAEGVVYLLAGPLSGEVVLPDVTDRVTGGQYAGGTGMTVAPAGDLDDDGYADLLVGGPSYDTSTTDTGAAWFVPGPIGGTQRLTTAPWSLHGTTYLQGLGATLATGDIDGDDRLDVIVAGAGGSGQNGEAVLCVSPSSGVLLATDATARWLGAAGDRAGAALLPAGDLDADGDEELLLGAPGAGSGTVYALLGGPGI